MYGGEIVRIRDYDYGPIGTRLRNARTMKKCTQEYVANKLGVSSQHISEIERGLSGLSIPSLMEICRILDIDADYILFGTVTRDNHNPLNEILVKMTPEQSSHAEEIIKAYAKSFGIIS